MVTEEMITDAANALGKYGVYVGASAMKYALEAALSTEECQYSKDNNIPEHRCAVRCVYEEECALSTDAEPVKTVTDETVDRIIPLIKGQEWDKMRAYSTVDAVRKLVKSVLEAAPSDIGIRSALA